MFESSIFQRISGVSSILNLPISPPSLFFRCSLRTSFFKIPLSSVRRFDSRYRDEKKSIFLRGGKNSRDVSRQRVEISKGKRGEKREVEGKGGSSVDRFASVETERRTIETR